LALLPIGILDAGKALLDPHLLLIGLGVALLSSVLPFSLELEALRRLPTQVFGVLLSLDPAIAALVGALILHETFDLRAMFAIACVTLAAIGSSRFRKRIIA
ncbi:MAG: EamA family transporter, partial [Ktedonobacterales bacterium]